MITWDDEAFCLSVRVHGENAAILEVYAAAHGRVAAYVHGGASKRKLADLQPGNGIAVSWKGRLAEQLGHFTAEMTHPRAAAILGQGAALAALNSVTAFLRRATPERQASPSLYEATVLLLDSLAEGGPDAAAIWPLLYVRWELGLLASLGYGLDLEKCAVTGVNEDLSWVSPRTGRAASREAGEPFADKLLALPPFLHDADAEERPNDLADAFALTGHFLDRRIFDPMGEGMPNERRRLIETLGRSGRL
jgi:DNA repair protein RecO (recombination protein O)